MILEIRPKLKSSITLYNNTDKSAEYSKFLDSILKACDPKYAFHYNSREFGEITIHTGIYKHMTTDFSCILYVYFEIDDRLDDKGVEYRLYKDNTLIKILHEKLSILINELNEEASKIHYPIDRPFIFDSKTNSLVIHIDSINIDPVDYDALVFYDSIIDSDMYNYILK